jgi:hypothetical protein
MSTAPASVTSGLTKIHAAHSSEKRLGNWTDARSFTLRARRGSLVIDLRSAAIPDGDIDLDLDVDHASVKLLVADDAVIDQWNLAWTGRGKVKQTYHGNPDGAGRVIRLTGSVRHGEIRVHSGGIARLSAMCSRAYLADARRAHATGGTPTLDAPGA